MILIQGLIGLRIGASGEGSKIYCDAGKPRNQGVLNPFYAGLSGARRVKFGD